MVTHKIQEVKTVHDPNKMHALITKMSRTKEQFN